MESIPGRLSDAWMFGNTRTPVSVVFENLEAGLTVEELMEEVDVTREQIAGVLEFVAHSLEAAIPPSYSNASVTARARSL